MQYSGHEEEGVAKLMGEYARAARSRRGPLIGVKLATVLHHEALQSRRQLRVPVDHVRRKCSGDWRYALGFCG